MYDFLLGNCFGIREINRIKVFRTCCIFENYQLQGWLCVRPHHVTLSLINFLYIAYPVMFNWLCKILLHVYTCRARLAKLYSNDSCYRCHQSLVALIHVFFFCFFFRKKLPFFKFLFLNIFFLTMAYVSGSNTGSVSVLYFI